MKIYNIIDKKEYLEEVAILEYEEWADNKNVDKEIRIKNKINKIENNLNRNDFCKLILLDNKELIGFISIFPFDCNECPDLSPWYSTMYVKEKYRGKGYSKLLNDAILQEAKNRKYKEIYLKTELTNYYEKFGAKLIKVLDNNEKIYKFILEGDN